MFYAGVWSILKETIFKENPLTTTVELREKIMTFYHQLQQLKTYVHIMNVVGYTELPIVK